MSNLFLEDCKASLIALCGPELADVVMNTAVEAGRNKISNPEALLEKRLNEYNGPNKELAHQIAGQKKRKLEEDLHKTEQMARKIHGDEIMDFLMKTAKEGQSQMTGKDLRTDLTKALSILEEKLGEYQAKNDTQQVKQLSNTVTEMKQAITPKLAVCVENGLVNFFAPDICSLNVVGWEALKKEVDAKLASSTNNSNNQNQQAKK